MASILNDTPFRDRRVHERRQLRMLPVTADGMRVSWGGIWGGVLVALGMLLLLAALGVAVGVSAFDPGEDQAQGFGTGAGIWAAFSLLLSLFIGGMVATRIGAIFDRTTGFFEGALVWVVSVLLAGYLASTGISTVAGGAFKMIGGATQVMGSVVQSSGGAGPNVDPGQTVDQMLQQLRDPKTAQQIAQATGMQQSEVASTLNETAQRVEQNRDNPTQAAAEAKQGMSQLYEKAKSSGALQQKAQEMKPEATAAAWISFGALLLSLIAAVAGALVGRRQAVHSAPRAPA